MPFLQLLLGVLITVAALSILISYLCFRMAFYVTKKQKTVTE